MMEKNMSPKPVIMLTMSKTTHQEQLEYQRTKRKENNNAYTRKYEKTPNGFLMRLYRNMKSRVTGVQSLKSHLYYGKELLPKDEFYKWAKTGEFYDMFSEWVESGYDRKLTPTVDRIDETKGYTINNMRWLTHSENSRIGALHARGIYT